MDPLALWRRYKDCLCDCPSLGLSLDISRMAFDQGYFERMEAAMARAYEAMNRLEGGEIANPDENRMVGHYWLRHPDLAPTDELIAQIQQTLVDLRSFAAGVHEHEITPPKASRFTDLVVIGIGGSALGPQLVADALGSRRDKLNVHFMDNTDPDGFDRLIAALGARLKSTLAVVISKSGGTPETRNGMIELAHAMQAKGLELPSQAVAITQEGSALDQMAVEQEWLGRFPMWDFVGGRTSITSAVGLLPAALQGLDIDGLLQGAAEMDQLTRQGDTPRNPAALMALMWYAATDGRGGRDMVILPYKDRLLLLSRYLQQLIMESLGKEKDLDGNTVHQGLTVYGNKGSTDQHAFVQQLRDGLDNFFVTFITVLEDRVPATARNAPEVEPQVTSGDYLNGFWQGTRQALSERGRQSMSLILQRFDARALGGLIALFERAVGFYATLVNINAYHQPGVEAGKKAASDILGLQRALLAYLQDNPAPATCEQIADRMGRPQQVEAIHHVLSHLVANRRGVARTGKKFRWKG